MMFSSDEFAPLKIPLEYILIATNNFADENVNGRSEIEKRYKGQLLWSGELIKIDARRFNKDLDDGEQIFWTEISILSSLKHKNVISLVGFCDDNNEKIIINRCPYRGSLVNYLSDPISLTWVRRLEISVGVAHALSYIHYDEPRDFSVIHRRLCSTTIRLNDDWEPKLSDFECSMKIEASKRHHSFHTNRLEYVKGYGDPTYIETKSVNHKSDIYSFGIVLFELLCGRESIIANDSDKYLAPLAVTHYREKRLDEIIDWDLWNQMDSQSFDIFAETAYECLNEERSQRPNIDEVVTRLEKALELHLEHKNVEGENYIFKYYVELFRSTPSTADSRVSRGTSTMSVYGHNFAVPVHLQNFALMNAQAAMSNAPSGNSNDKKQQHHQQQQSQQQGLKRGGVDSSSPYAMFQSLPESLRQTYHNMLAAPAGAASVHHSLQKKDFRIFEEASRAAAGHDSSKADDDRKGSAGLTGKSGQSIAYSRPDLG